MPKISIVLTSYNHEKFLRDSIDSVLAQTFTDFELIIWDDASSDSSWEIIQSYSDRRIRPFRNEKNRFSHYGVNKSIAEIARGEYIAMHHSDDVWMPEKLQRQIEYLDGHSQCGAVFTRTHTIGEDGAPLDDATHHYSRVFDQPNRSRSEWLRHFFFQGNALCHPSVLIRKRCFDECGLYSEALAQLPDFEMWVRLCFKFDIHVLPERLTKFRVRAGEMNSSGSRPEVRIRDRSEFHFVLRHYFSIGSFDELQAIFPEAKNYYREEGCIPEFVMSMVALDAKSLLWAKFRAIEKLYELFADEAVSKRIIVLYQFGFRDLIKLTGKYDLFSMESIALLNGEIAKRDALIQQQAQRIARYEKQSPGQDYSAAAATGQTAGTPSEADRATYAQAARLLESGGLIEGKAMLEALAQQGNSCWEVYNDLAVQYFNEGDYVRAVPCFEKGMALEGDAGTTARNCASMLLSAGEVNAALSVWGRILQEQPWDVEILEILRQVLSNINPIPPDAWGQLVADLRSGVFFGEPAQIPIVYSGAIEETNGRKAGAPVGEIRIFQIYYDENSRSMLDPAFIPLDNSENERPDWFEYWPIRKVLLSQRFDDDTYLGFFSPKFCAKTGLNGKQVLDFVRHCDDDVISFSPFLDQGAIHNNPFLQGEANHPGLIAVSRKVLELLQVELDPESLVCDQTTTIFCNFFVARYSFWKKWFAYFEKIFDVCEGADSELKASLLGQTDYRPGNNYEMKIFILERLVTIVLEELGIRCRLGSDFMKAPTLLPGSKESLEGLVICDALKGQYRRTGLPVYLDTLLKVRGN